MWLVGPHCVAYWATMRLDSKMDPIEPKLMAFVSKVTDFFSLDCVSTEVFFEVR